MAHEGCFQAQIRSVGSWQVFAHPWASSAGIRLCSLTKLCIPDLPPAMTEPLLSVSPSSAIPHLQFGGMCPKTESSGTGCVLVSIHLLCTLSMIPKAL